MKLLILTALIVLSGCSSPKTTVYFCLSPMGWVTFQAGNSKITEHYNGTISVDTGDKVLTFSSCTKAEAK